MCLEAENSLSRVGTSISKDRNLNIQATAINESVNYTSVDFLGAHTPGNIPQLPINKLNFKASL